MNSTWTVRSEWAVDSLSFQIQYFSALTFAPQPVTLDDNKAAFILKEAVLSHFINSAEWKLSGIFVKLCTH